MPVRVKRFDHIALVTMDRQKNLNAFNTYMIEELGEAYLKIEADDDIYASVITGAGRSFVSGADIAEMERMSATEAKRFSYNANSVFLRLENTAKPVIAAINGFAIGGGCELAMSCDIRLASEKAKFGQPEVGLGITPGFSGTQRLPRRVGVAKAKELIFSGKMIKADEAEKIGLVNAVYAPEALMDGALEMAKSFTKNAPIAVRACKKAINDGLEVKMDDAIVIEEKLFGSCFKTADQIEGMSAFLEKRKHEPYQNK